MTPPPTLSSSPSPDNAFKAFLGVDRFGSLDGLRFLSIMAVLWHHSGIHLHVPLLERGQLGVHLFFAISGFLITSLMIRERRRNGQISLRGFYIRRSLRIFPLYYAILLVYIVLVSVMERGTADGQEFFRNLPAFATYTSNWFVTLESGERVIFYFVWSLAVEEQFYLTWPWVERYFKPRLKFAALAAIIAVVFANHLGLLLWAIPKESLGHRILWYIAPCILFGVAGAHLLHSPRGFAAAWRLFGHRWSAPVMLGLTLAAASQRAGQAWEYLVYLCLAGLVASCIVREDNGLAPVLRLRLIARVGIVSYGIYMMHMLCFNTMDKLGHAVGITNRWPLWLGGIVLVYITAELSFRTFERFFQQLKSKFSRPRRTDAHGSSPSPAANPPPHA